MPRSHRAHPHHHPPHTAHTASSRRASRVRPSGRPSDHLYPSRSPSRQNQAPTSSRYPPPRKRHPPHSIPSSRRCSYRASRPPCMYPSGYPGKRKCPGNPPESSRQAYRRWQNRPRRQAKASSRPAKASRCGRGHRPSRYCPKHRPRWIRSAQPGSRYRAHRILREPPRSCRCRRHTHQTAEAKSATEDRRSCLHPNPKPELPVPRHRSARP